MHMLKTDEAFQKAIELRVAEIERKSAAEVVVVAAQRSSHWPELPLIAGSLAAWLSLAFLCWSPWPFHPDWFPFDAAAVGGLVGLLSRKLPLVMLVPERRRRERVRQAAEAAFFQESVHATAERTGVLVYLSVAEQMVELLPDQGVLGKIPGATWNEIRLSAENLQVLDQELSRMGEVLAEYLPRGEGDRNELPDAPRVRP